MLAELSIQKWQDCSGEVAVFVEFQRLRFASHAVRNQQKISIVVLLINVSNIL